MTIIEDGYVSAENLKKAGKDEQWLQRVLKEKKADKKNTLLLTVDPSDRVVWIGKEGQS